MDYESAETLLSIKNGGYPSVDQIKTEIEEDDMMDIDEHQISANSLDSSMEAEPVDEDDEDNNEEAMPELGPAALGLQRVGTKPPPRKNKPPTQPIQVLNRRGMPARIRKKNKLFYDDIMVNHPHHRIKKEPGSLDVKPSPKKMARPSPAKKMLRMSVGGDSMKKSSSSSSSGGSMRDTTSYHHHHHHHQSPMKEERDSSAKSSLMMVKMQQQQQHQQQQQSQQSQQQQNQQNQQNQQQQPSSPDRRIGQKIGMRLRNLLKLPKAHKWVCYEWFYSNIDKTLFEGDNDFMICLKESFPQLKTRKLTRVEWCKIRRMMGKPRRCSQSFFEEERRELERKRQKIRMLQQRKCSDVQMFKDLPSEIPLQLVIGTKVTARLRKPQDGLFTGSIDAVDTSNNTYRITFERAGLGTHSVPDYEVLGNEPPETITVASFARKFRPSHVQYVPSPPYMSKLNNNSPRLSSSDPLISSSNASIPKKPHMGGTMNGYPVKLLESMVRLRKILSEKRIKVQKLKEMNTDCEMRRSLGEPLPPEFERKYAGIVVELERMNLALQEFLNEVQDMCLDMAPEPSVAAMLAPSHLREKCRQEASDMVAKNNMINDKEPNKMTQLVTDLTALILQVKCLSDSDKNAYELQVLQGTMEQIKSKLAPQNLQVFQNCVEVHMQHIQLGLGQLGALTPFMTQKT